MLGETAPVQTYWSVEFLPLQQIVRFGTYGRGVWDFAIDEVVSVSAPEPGQQVSTLAIYPNPVTGQVLSAKLGHLTERVCDWRIIDLSGGLKASGRSMVGGGKDLSINLPPDMLAGVYLLEVRHEGRLHAGKWIRM